MKTSAPSSLLDEAIAVAVEAHRGQTDRSGEPYVLHPLRVMMRMETEPERITAVLHDVVEDSDLTLDDLRERGFPEEVVRAVDCLTRRDDEHYDSLIERARSDRIARRVKLGDLEDNMDPRRMGEITPENAERLRRYHRAWRSLRDEA